MKTTIWNCMIYLKNYGIYENSSEEPTIESQEVVLISIPNKGIQTFQTVNKRKVLTQQEKYKSTINQCQQISRIMSEMNTERFNTSLLIL